VLQHCYTRCNTHHIATLLHALLHTWLVGADGLAGLPLALVQAARFVKRRRLTFAAYRASFEARRLELMQREAAGA